MEEEIEETIIGHYILQDEIEYGCFGRVFKGLFHIVLKIKLGYDLKTKETVVLKEVSKRISEGDWIEAVQNALIKQESTNLNCVVKLLDIEAQTDSTFIILEFCEGCDLGQKLELKEESFRFQMQNFCAQISIAFLRLEQNQDQNYDVHPSNFFLSSNSKNAILKIATYSHIPEIQQTVFDPLYCSPELLMK
jgi:serine/threonine protein kinase